MVTKPERIVQALKGRGCVSHQQLCKELDIPNKETLIVHVQHARQIYGRRSIVNVYGTGYKLGTTTR